MWTWTAIDADSKLILSFFVGDRGMESTTAFMTDLRLRVKGRPQLTTDQHGAYQGAVDWGFGHRVDFAQLVQVYSQSPTDTTRYSPGKCVGATKRPLIGNTDERRISTSYVERQHLTMRMSMRRFTRLTNAFSKKLDNHIHALALYFVFYNFCRIHKTLKTSPAMAVGASKTLWSLENIVAKINKIAAAPSLPDLIRSGSLITQWVEVFAGLPTYSMSRAARFPLAMRRIAHSQKSLQ